MKFERLKIVGVPRKMKAACRIEHPHITLAKSDAGSVSQIRHHAGIVVRVCSSIAMKMTTVVVILDIVGRWRGIV